MGKENWMCDQGIMTGDVSRVTKWDTKTQYHQVITREGCGRTSHVTNREIGIVDEATSTSVSAEEKPKIS